MGWAYAFTTTFERTFGMDSSRTLQASFWSRWALVSCLMLGMVCWTVRGSPPVACPDCASCETPRCIKVPSSKTETRTTYCTKVDMKCVSNPCGGMWAWLCGKPASCKDCLQPIAVRKMIKRQIREQVPTDECKYICP